jgi:hypothetical protein
VRLPWGWGVSDAIEVAMEARASAVGISGAAAFVQPVKNSDKMNNRVIVGSVRFFMKLLSHLSEIVGNQNF